ncbi:MAG: CPBP family intramembrane metalloprotease [Prevotellaceae bacterium]|jgi:membrane protease YdiL (CAAX protease family)|nr:CPBP family intramembrane metalloprotease [Prevotellaceae bacterium]
MNQKIIVSIQLALFVFFAVFFELLILNNVLIVITSIQFAPLLAYILFILFFKNKAVQIIFDLNKKIVYKSILAIIVPALLMGIPYLIIKITGIVVSLNTINQNLSMIYPMLLAQLLGSIGEEIGWRSFLQTTLEKMMPVLFSSIIVGMIWGLWHIPVHSSAGIIVMITFILMTIMFSIIMAIILKDTKNNIIISVLMHTSFNVSAFVLLNPSVIVKETLSIIALVMLIITIIMVLKEKEYLLKQKNCA